MALQTAFQREQDHLFAELPVAVSDGKFTDPFSKWFSRFLHSCNSYRPETTFHSFRHGVSLSLKLARVYPANMDAIMGWKDNNTMSSRYGNTIPFAALVEDVEKIRYPDLDLSHLYPDSQ